MTNDRYQATSLKVAAFTGGLAVPSARFRVRQYIESLRHVGIQIQEFPATVGSYPPRSHIIRPLWAVSSLMSRLPGIALSYRCDLTLFQREMLSTFVTLEPLTIKPRILDVDDAIFLLRKGHFARRLAQMSDGVICGNAYLAEWFGAWNRNVTIIPTAVNIARYVPPSRHSQIDDRKVIGWIGTSTNLRYLYAIEAALAKVMTMIPKAQLLVVCDQFPKFQSIDPNRIKYIRWEEKIEVESIQSMDIGIMPLEDTPWARGKCSFKMLQYMACGLPVVVSPVGMNAEVLAVGDVGIGASTGGQWVEALVSLLDNQRLRSEMGASGRRVVEKSYSINALAPRLAGCLRGV